MKRLEPDGKLDAVQIGPKSNQTTQINKSLSTSLKEKLLTFSNRHVDLFAWTTADIPGINPKFICHHLVTFPKV